MSKREMRDKLLQELDGYSRNEISAVSTVVNNKSKYSVPTYGTKDQLLHGLEGVDACVLEDAMDAVLPTEDFDDEEYEEESDEDEEIDADEE